MSRLSRIFAVNIHPLRDRCDLAFVFMFVASALLRLIWLDQPTGMLIFDEVYYVNVARILLRIPQSPIVWPSSIPGIDTVNREHPPLAKLIIALSMRVLGDNAWGWRIPSVLFGLLAILVLYILLKRVSKSSAIALLGTFLFSFDNLAFVHSRIATLDIFMLAFMLLGFYWYFSGRVLLSAFAMALSTLCKIGGLYGVLALGVFHLVRELTSKERKVNWRYLIALFGVYANIYLVSFLSILTILDFFWSGSNDPFVHLAYIYVYTFGLRAPAVRAVTAIWSYPWEWLMNGVKIPYAVVSPGIRFVGAMNPAIIFMTVPAIVYSVVSYCKKRNELALFTLAWFAMTYLTFIPTAILTHRVMYIYYFLTPLPAVAAAIANMIIEQRPPRIITVLYIAAVIIGFYSMFPFTS